MVRLGKAAEKAGTEEDTRFYATIVLYLRAWAAVPDSPEGFGAALVQLQGAKEEFVEAEETPKATVATKKDFSAAIKQALSVFTLITQFSSDDHELVQQVMEQVREAQSAIELLLVDDTKEGAEAARAELLCQKLGEVQELAGKAASGDIEAWQDVTDLALDVIDLQGKIVVKEKESSAKPKQKVEAKPELKAKPGIDVPAAEDKKTHSASPHKFQTPKSKPGTATIRRPEQLPAGPTCPKIEPKKLPTEHPEAEISLPEHELYVIPSGVPILHKPSEEEVAETKKAAEGESPKTQTPKKSPMFVSDRSPAAGDAYLVFYHIWNNRIHIVGGEVARIARQERVADEGVR